MSRIVDTAKKQMSRVAGPAKESIQGLWDNVVEATGFRIIRYPLLHYPSDRNVYTLALRGYRQTQSYTCGYVVGRMVLDFLNPGQSAREFFQLVQPDREYGTPPVRLVRALRASGIRVGDRNDLSFDFLASFIKKGMPIIVCVHKRRDISHWVVVYGVGYRPNRVFISGDGLPFLNRRCEWTYTDFRKKWVSFGEGLVCSCAGDRRTPSVAGRTC